MSHLNDLTSLENPDNIKQLLRIRDRDNELIKIYKLELIISIIKQAPIQNFKLPELENLKKSLKIFSVQNYLKLDDNLTLLGTYLWTMNSETKYLYIKKSFKNLGLDNCKTVSLSYTERKAIFNYINKEIPKRCIPIINYIKNIQKEWPDIFKKEAKRNEILALEEKRKNLYIKLSELKYKKCRLLKLCADLKIGPNLKNELNLRYLNHKLQQIKANAVKGFLLQGFFSNTDHTMKAIKEITKYIEEELEE